MRPDMPRWITSVSPLSSAASRYLARRLRCIDLAARQALGEMRREGDAQIAAPDPGLGDDMAFQRGRKAQADGFDFGQFGHFLALSLCHMRAVVT